MSSPPLIVIDTNVVLDLFIFSDTLARPLRAALEAEQFSWMATESMRTELERVLAYTHLLPRMAFYRLQAQDVLDAFDRHCRIVPVAPSVPVVCKDRDDQKFIDLAVQHRSLLLSKDRAVLKLRRRLEKLGVHTAPALAMLPGYAAHAVPAGELQTLRPQAAAAVNASA
ncbi:putative toxin-antitoxin system toxin component, PIN family [Comamonadaceae bacterium PP-2]